MRTSDAIDQIATALAAAQAEMKNATLNKINPHFKSKYADLACIRDTVTPALSKHGIAVVQGTDTVDSGIVVVTKLVHKSGQWMESRFPIAYDKPQTMGSAYTYARRYSLSAMCSIAAEEDDDANAANDKPVAAPEPKYARSAIVRQEFERLQKGIHQIDTSGTLEDLKLFWASNAKTIAGLPADWKAELENAKEEAKENLTSKVAA
jgi:hypothetical protein